MMLIFFKFDVIFICKKLRQFLFCCILYNVLVHANLGPQGRTEATCIITDWVSQTKEEINKKNKQSCWLILMVCMPNRLCM